MPEELKEILRKSGAFRECVTRWYQAVLFRFRKYLTTCSIGWCSQGLEARTDPLLDVNDRPMRSVTMPPASLTINDPPAMSHGFRSLSQKPSSLPAPT